MSRPVFLEGTVYRVVRSSDTHVEVQEWQGMYWQPSARPLWSVEEGSPAPVALLEALGVPEESWLVDGQKRWTTPELRVLTIVEVAELTRQEVVA
jgi:hypothetical protein